MSVMEIPPTIGPAPVFSSRKCWESSDAGGHPNLLSNVFDICPPAWIRRSRDCQSVGQWPKVGLEDKTSPSPVGCGVLPPQAIRLDEIHLLASKQHQMTVSPKGQPHSLAEGSPSCTFAEWLPNPQPIAQGFFLSFFGTRFRCAFLRSWKSWKKSPEMKTTRNQMHVLRYLTSPKPASAPVPNGVFLICVSPEVDGGGIERKLRQRTICALARSIIGGLTVCMILTVFAWSETPTTGDNRHGVPLQDAIGPLNGRCSLVYNFLRLFTSISHLRTHV